MPDDEKPVEVGSFRVARERMLEILKQYQLPDPLLFGKSVLRAASAGGAARFQLRSLRETAGLFRFVRGVCGVEFRFDGTPLTPVELKDPFQALVQEEEGGTSRGRELAFGIVNALRLEPEAMTLIAGAGEGRVSVSIRNDLSVESRPAPGPESDTVLRLTWNPLPAALHRGGPGILLGPVAPACGFPVVVEGERRVYCTDHPGLLGWDFKEGPMRGRVRIPDDPRRPGRLDLFLHGVFAESVPLDRARVPVDGFVDDERLRLNLSQTAVVRDEAFDAVLREAGRQGERMMADEAVQQDGLMSGIARALYEPKMRKVWNEALGGADTWMVVARDDVLSRAGRLLAGLVEAAELVPAASKRQVRADAARTGWLREACVRLLSDFDKDVQDPLLAILWRCRLLAGTDGSGMRLEELFTLQRRHGRIPVSRQVGPRSGDPRVWLACEEDSLFLSRMAGKARWTFSE